MKRIFLSLPLSGRTREEIDEDLVRMKSHILLNNPFEGEEIQFVENSGMTKDDIDPVQFSNAVTPNLLYLGAAIMKMAVCDAVYFDGGWTRAKGCQIERDIAYTYGIPCYIFESLTQKFINMEDLH